MDRPTAGSLSVLGSADPGDVRDRIAFVPQDKPLYPQLTVADTLWAGAELNPGRWDRATAERIAGPLARKARVRSLSGGQRTRLALALALGKRPELMLLDEPMADLDPLARHELMGVLMAETAEHGTTIVMSSHILTELEGACDYLLFVDGGRVRLGGEAEDIVSAHALLTGRDGDLSPAHRRRVPYGRTSPHRSRTEGGPRGHRRLDRHGTVPGGAAPRPPPLPRTPHRC